MIQEKDNKAIVLGLSGVTSLGIIRTLGESGVTLYGINRTGTKGSGYYSKYLMKRYYRDEGYSDCELLQFLLENNEFQGSYLFASNDLMVRFLADNGPQLRERGIFGMNSSLTGDELLNKKFIKEFARQAGFNIPGTYSYNKNSVNIDEFPVIIKPVNNVRYNKKDSKVIRSYKEFAETFENQCDNDFYIEEYIDGDTESLYEIYGYRTENGEIAIPCMCQKLRQYPHQNGTGSYVRTTYIAELVEPVKRFVEKIDLAGLFNIEVKFCRTRKKFYFIESNFRAGAQIYLVSKSGVNIPYNFVNDIYDPLLKCRDDVYWLDLIDLKNLNKTVSLSRFVGDCMGADCYAGISGKDPWQFIMYFLLRVKIYMRKILRQRIMRRQ